MAEWLYQRKPFTAAPIPAKGDVMGSRHILGLSLIALVLVGVTSFAYFRAHSFYEVNRLEMPQGAELFSGGAKREGIEGRYAALSLEYWETQYRWQSFHSWVMNMLLVCLALECAIVVWLSCLLWRIRSVPVHWQPLKNP